MTTAWKERPARKKQSLRRRMVISLLCLTLLPLVVAMTSLFFVVGDYIADIQRLQPNDQLHDQFISVSIQAAFLLSLFGVFITALIWRMADQFLRPLLKIRSGAEIVARINLSHRIELDSDDELGDLALEFNLMAENLGKAYNELEGRVREATRTVQEERNRLATVLRTMVDGVVVTNETVETILMNPRARIILDLGYTYGIGSPLSRIFPSERLDYHLKRLRQRWEHGRESVEDVIAQVFLCLISLLPARGVRTLADAKAFCDRHLLLRWQSSRF